MGTEGGRLLFNLRVQQFPGHSLREELLMCYQQPA